jgi:hypothetical protein
MNNELYGTERTKEKTQYGMREEGVKAKEMVKQVAIEKEKAKAGLVHGVLDRRRRWAKHNVISAPQLEATIGHASVSFFIEPAQEQSQPQ